MQPKTCVVVIIVFSSLTWMLLMPFDENPSRRHEAKASEQNANDHVILLIAPNPPLISVFETFK